MGRFLRNYGGLPSRRHFRFRMADTPIFPGNALVTEIVSSFKHNLSAPVIPRGVYPERSRRTSLRSGAPTHVIPSAGMRRGRCRSRGIYAERLLRGTQKAPQRRIEREPENVATFRNVAADAHQLSLRPNQFPGDASSE